MELLLLLRLHAELTVGVFPTHDESSRGNDFQSGTYIANLLAAPNTCAPTECRDLISDRGWL